MTRTLPIYQADLKAELAVHYGVPTTALDLPYELWALIRDAHAAKYQEQPDATACQRLAVAQDAATWAMTEAERLASGPVRIVMTVPAGMPAIESVIADRPIELLVLSHDGAEIANAEACGSTVLVTADENRAAGWHKRIPLDPFADSELVPLFKQLNA